MILPLMMTVSFLSIPVERVYDGDTFFVTIPGAPDLLGANLGVRITGIDTPELSDTRKCMKKEAALARDVLASTLSGKQVDLNFCFRDKFYRLNCSVRIHDGIDLGELMLRLDHAVPYSGGTKIKRACK